MHGEFWNNHGATYNYDKEIKRVFKLRFYFFCREIPRGMFPPWTLTHRAPVRRWSYILSVFTRR